MQNTKVFQIQRIVWANNDFQGAKGGSMLLPTRQGEAEDRAGERRVV